MGASGSVTPDPAVGSPESLELPFDLQQGVLPQITPETPFANAAFWKSEICSHGGEEPRIAIQKLTKRRIHVLIPCPNQNARVTSDLRSEADAGK